ncbi:MAG: ABC transporter permease subunit [Phycisphaerae bacterium]|nr:ABC transporter permease subunit [Phycisphaerae bacterium]
MSAIVVPCMHRIAAPPTALANISAIAFRELRDAVRSRWFLLDTIAFLGLGLGVSYISSASAGGAGLSGFGRTTAGLLNLVLLVVPLMSLTAGASSVASDRERGMLAYLLAQPIARWELLVGKYVGISAALLACIALGLGGCAGILAWKGEATNPSSIVWLAGLSFALALAMLSVGMLVSVLARKASVAVGTAVFLWLALVFATDLGLMAGTLAFKLRIETLFYLCVANPLQVFKMWSLHAVDTSLDVLGPAGLYAMDTYGERVAVLFALVFAAWIAVPLALAIAIFSRRSPV